MSNPIQPGIYVAECSGTDKPLKGLIVKSKMANINDYIVHEIKKFRGIQVDPVWYWKESKVRRWIEKHKATMVF